MLAVLRPCLLLLVAAQIELLAASLDVPALSELTEKRLRWAAVSRAVRTPSRIEDDGRLPIAAFPSMGGPPGGVYLVQTGNPDIKSETLIAYEVGYREQVTEEFAWDLAGFYHDFDDVLSSTTLPPIFPPFTPEGGVVVPRQFAKNGVAHAYGFEFSSSWQATEAWRLFGSYSFLRTEADGTPAPTDARNQFYVQSFVIGVFGEKPFGELLDRLAKTKQIRGRPILIRRLKHPDDYKPCHILYITATGKDSWDVATDLQFDSIRRYVDNQYGASSYTAMDLRLAWQPSDGVDVFVVGRHLLDQEHDELVSDPVARTSGTQVEREVFGGVVLRF